MTRPPPWNLRLPIYGLLFTLFVFTANAADWTPNNFPNPTAGAFKQCNMKSTASICDPDGILTESQRYRLNHELNQLESRTRQDHAGDFCQKKGITGAMAIAKHFAGGTEAAVKAAANEMLRTWDLDSQCQKSIVIVMSTEDKKFWVARGDRVPVYGEEFTAIFNAQKQHFKNGDYSQGMQNILQQTWEKALSKQTGGAPSGGGRQQPKPQPPPYSGGGGDSGGKGPSMPSIPWKLIALLVVVVLPLLCCCGCIYCCCCRGKGSNAGPSRTPADIEGGYGGGGSMPRGGGGGGGAGRAGLGGFLGGMGGSAAMSGISNFIRSRGGRGGGAGVPAGQPMEPMMGGGTAPPADDGTIGGQGLYPDVKKADAGGGGSW